MPIELTVDQQMVQALRGRLDKEADGRKLRRQLSTGMRKAMEPMVADAVANVRATGGSMPVHENYERGSRRRRIPVADSAASLRTAVASGVKAEARLTGRSTGAKIHAKRKGMPRGFANAPKRLNRGSWRHPVFGTNWWVQQTISPAGWFDRATVHSRHLDQVRHAVLRAMEDMAQRIAR